MKKIFLFLFIYTILVCTNCTNNKEFKPDYQGNIVSITASIYEAVEKFGEVQVDDLEKVVKIEFNENHNIVKETTYDEDGDLDALVKYHYNDNNQLISFIGYDYDGEESYRMEYTFEGKFIATSSYKSKYNDIKYEFKNNGKFIVESKLYMDGKFKQYTKYEKAGNVFKHINYDADGTEIGIGTEEYDNNNLLIKYIASDGKVSVIKRGKNGLPIKLTNVHISIYSNELYNSTELSIGNQTAEIEYEYDKKGNWVKKQIRVMEDDKDDEFYIVTRTVEYR